MEIEVSLMKKQKKELYDYQKKGLDKIFDALDRAPENHNLLYQLPTGGGKTVIFSEIALESQWYKTITYSFLTLEVIWKHLVKSV